MKLFIKSSNSLDVMADEIVEVVSQKTGDVFQPIILITQTEGMRSWLKTRIAEKAGIAANILFLKPNELIEKIFNVTGGRYERVLSQSDLQWLIFRALGETSIVSKHPALAGYLMQGNELSAVKRIALSRELADLFDQYQIYRPAMLKQWEQNSTVTEASEEKWQMEVWNFVRAVPGKKMPDKSRIRHSILHNLQDAEWQRSLQTKIPAVYFFGISLITEFHHEILTAVSQYIPIHFYLPNPSPHLYWYEDRSKKSLFYQRRKGQPVEENAISNPLLVNWGKLIQNTFLMFFKNDEALNQYLDMGTAPHGRTLLSTVQKMIYANEEADAISVNELEDSSIVITSAYSIAREVESLYNYLVKIIDDNPGKYSMRDIVVHVTDINRYASYIRAVFDTAPHEMRYTIADESYTSSDTISQALYEVLTLEANDFTSENVVQLLNFSAIRRHFQIGDIPLIRRVVHEANIRHGIEGNTDDDSVLVSWQYGLQRMMYGICILGEQEYNPGDGGFFPLTSIEGSDANEVINFVYFTNRLITLIGERKHERTVSQWIEYLYEVIRNLLFNQEETDNEEFRKLTEHFKLMTVSEELFHEKISYEVFLRQFLPGLSEMSQGYKFARGGITFCSLIPMRSIPFKIVAMLGLDFDKFPRKTVAAGFDLMHKYPMPGDRSIKVNDKHLFLETLMSAGDYLYLSYNGQRIQDKTKRPPSILIDELISFIEASAADPAQVRKKLIREEPLHGFSGKYGNLPGFETYLLANGRSPVLKQQMAPQAVPLLTLDLRTLYQFLSNPVEFYFRNRVGIRFDDEQATLPEVEDIELNALEKWKLKSDLLTAGPAEVSDIIDRQKKEGNFPLKSSAEYEVHKALEETQEIRQAFARESGGLAPHYQFFEVVLNGGVVLSATIDSIFGNKVLVPCLSKNPGKSLLRALLNALIISAHGSGFDVLHISSTTEVAKGWSQTDARGLLSRFIALMEQGTSDCIPFQIGWSNELKPCTQSTLRRTIDKCIETDHYLDLAMRQGFLEDCYGPYLKMFAEVFDPIIETFKT